MALTEKNDFRKSCAIAFATVAGLFVHRADRLTRLIIVCRQYCCQSRSMSYNNVFRCKQSRDIANVSAHCVRRNLRRIRSHDVLAKRRKSAGGQVGAFMFDNAHSLPITVALHSVRRCVSFSCQCRTWALILFVGFSTDRIQRVVGTKHACCWPTNNRYIENSDELFLKSANRLTTSRDVHNHLKSCACMP